MVDSMESFLPNRPYFLDMSSMYPRETGFKKKHHDNKEDGIDGYYDDLHGC